jgi:hypothetical protein
MNRDEHLAHLRDEEDRELFAIRRQEERMEVVQREMEDDLDKLDEDEHRAERSIEAELRKEHWGHGPERPLSWRSDTGDGARERGAGDQNRARGE